MLGKKNLKMIKFIVSFMYNILAAPTEKGLIVELDGLRNIIIKS